MFSPLTVSQLFNRLENLKLSCLEVRSKTYPIIYSHTIRGKVGQIPKCIIAHLSNLSSGVYFTIARLSLFTHP